MLVRHALLRASAIALGRRSVHTNLPEHPLKGQVNAFLHQRPFQRVDLPALVSSLTLMPQRWQATHRICDPDSGHASAASVLYSSEGQYEADYAHLCQLCDFFHVPPPPRGSTFFTTDLGGACKLRWERHTEAQTYTFTRSPTAEESAQPFSASSVAVSVIPSGWLASLPGLTLASVHVAMLDAPPSDFAAIMQHFHREAVVTGCSVDHGRFRVYSDWRTHADGFGRMIVHGMPVDVPNKRTAASKVLQRMIELDKYRCLALLGLPYAQKLTPQIDGLDAQLMAVTTAFGSSDRVWTQDELSTQRELLDQLCALSAESMRLHTSSSFRFAASSAYSQIVDDRIAFLQMERVDGLPSMSAFIAGALHPAMRTCEAVSKRLENLRTEMALTADLLRTSLTVQQQAQNIRELEQLQANAKTQLLLQESVEGLSVVAITYYATGVLAYMLKGASAVGCLPVPVELALGVSVPVLAAGVYLGLHRLKQGVLSGALNRK